MDMKEVTEPAYRKFELRLSKAELIGLANGEPWALNIVHELMTQFLSVGVRESDE